VARYWRTDRTSTVLSFDTHPPPHTASLRGLHPPGTTEEDLVASRLNPYISFDGNAREAMEFYKQVLGGTLALNTFGEFGEKDAPGADKIMHATLETDRGFTLMGADVPPGMEHRPGDNIAVSLSGDDADELRAYWARLSDGGTVSMPLEKQMWGDEFGMCVDRFGISWMVNISQPQS
jgi:PhnB protein